MTREEALASFIRDSRWFGGRGRDFRITAVRTLPMGIHLVEVTFADGEQDTYQVPLSAYDEPQDRVSHAMVGQWDGKVHYDAVHDPETTRRWLEAFDSSTRQGPLAFHRLDGHDLDLATHSTLYSGEQSNSSLAFGEDSLLKLFRRVGTGVNPDVEIHEVLTRAGSHHVAHLYGWLTADDGRGGEVVLAMLQQFLRTVTDGWDLALASVRNLFAEADLHPAECGGDFAGESRRLGSAVARVHALLREWFPVAEVPASELADAISRRFDAALATHPALAASAPGVRAGLAPLAGSGRSLATQRIHGDLHLGQTLRSSLDWKLVDFEGEPARPLADRVRPDSPWRDVAGMLRSFDYAARTVARDLQVDGDLAEQLSYRGAEWTHRNQGAFLAGYAEVAGEPTATDRLAITAYELDKAVYEVGYEARHRPDWIDIPLDALQRVAGQAPR